MADLMGLESELVETDLAEHLEARRQLNDLHSAASALPYGISPVKPPRHVKEALMARPLLGACFAAGFF